MNKSDLKMTLILTFPRLVSKTEWGSNTKLFSKIKNSCTLKYYSSIPPWDFIQALLRANNQGHL